MSVMSTDGRVGMEAAMDVEDMHGKQPFHRKGYTFEGCPTTIPNKFQAKISISPGLVRSGVVEV